MRAIMLAEANRIINGTFASARRRKAYALAAIVLDAGGRVKAFQKQDGASLMRFEIAYGKAFGALALNRSSRQVLQKAKEKPAFMASLSELSDGPLFLEAGGQLIRDASGEIVGATTGRAAGGDGTGAHRRCRWCGRTPRHTAAGWWFRSLARRRTRSGRPDRVRCSLCCSTRDQ